MKDRAFLQPAFSTDKDDLLVSDKLYTILELNRIDNQPLNFEGKTFMGVSVMANGLKIQYKHTVGYHKQNDHSRCVLYLEEVKK